MDLTDFTPDSPGLYTLVTGSGMPTAVNGTLSVNGSTELTTRSTTTNSYMYRLDNSVANTLAVKVVDATQKTTVTWTGVTGTWNTSAANWTGSVDGITVDIFLNGDDVVFGNGATNKNVVVDASGVTVGDMTISGDYNFSGSAITATGAVDIAGGKTLGLVAGSTAALNADTIDFNTSGKLDITVYSPDESSPYDNKAKNELTVITATGSGSITGFDSNNVTVAGATSVDFLTATARRDTDGSGNDIIVVETALSWYLDNTNAHGDFTIANGNEFTLGAVLDDEATNGSIWDGKTLTKKDDGTLTLTGANTYTGGTELNAGRINLGHNTALGTGALDMADGTTLGFAADGLAASNDINTTDSVTFDTDTNDAELSGIISGGGTFTKDGSGMLTLSGANSFTGTATIAEGTLALGAGGSLAGTTLVVDSGAPSRRAAPSPSPASK